MILRYSSTLILKYQGTTKTEIDHFVLIHVKTHFREHLQIYKKMIFYVTCYGILGLFTGANSLVEMGCDSLEEKVIQNAVLTGSMRVASVSEFYRKGTGFLREMKDRYLLFKQVTPVAVVMTVEEYKSMISEYETLRSENEVLKSSLSGETSIKEKARL